MIPATLHPPSEPLDVALNRSRALIAASRIESAKILADARKQATRYREKSKERGYRAGFERGLRESAVQCARTVESLQDLYATTVEAAQRDVSIVAYRLVEELIEEHLRERPEVLSSWMTRAIAHVKQTSSMTLRYHPRYEKTLHHIAPCLPSGITIRLDPTLEEVDFAIDTTIGAVTFSWRELLRSLKPTPSNGRSA